MMNILRHVAAGAADFAKRSRVREDGEAIARAGAEFDDLDSDFAIHAELLGEFEGVDAGDDIGVSQIVVEQLDQLPRSNGSKMGDEAREAIEDRPGNIDDRKEHTSELQSLMRHLVCRLLLEKKKEH